MDRRKICEGLRGLSANLFKVHKQLGHTIRKTSKRVMKLDRVVSDAKSAVAGMKKSVIAMKKSRDSVEKDLRNLASIRRDLSFVTEDTGVEDPVFVSSDDLDSDILTDDSTDDEVV